VLALLPLLLAVAPPALARSADLLSIASSRSVGVAWVLLIVSTFVWRGRTTEALNANPLDTAALLRVACVSAAGLALLAHLFRAPHGAGLPLPLKLFAGYVAVAFVAGVGSPQPLLATYRAMELAVALLALIAVACEPPGSWRRALDLVLLCLGAIVAIAWVEAVVMPHRAWEQVHGVVPWALIGAMPSFSSNSLGEYGALLGIWGLASLGTRRAAAVWATVGGVATLLATQYRTGLIAFVAALAFVVWRQRRSGVFLIILGAACLVATSGQTSALRGRAEVIFARGNASTVRTLDSRSIYWRAALPSVRERPFLGWGLNVGTRRVLSSLGLQTTSTIHSTWFETLLGTGLVGAALLATAFLTVLVTAIRCRGPDGAAIAGLAIVLSIRSLTGSTVELFDVNTLLFGALVLATASGAEAVRVGRLVPGLRPDVARA
jgi:O-antigen ligase